jgi:hypothetical protein
MRFSSNTHVTDARPGNTLAQSDSQFRVAEVIDALPAAM